MTEEIKKLSWLDRIFRNRAKLTYWLDDKVFQLDVSNFKERSAECIVFEDYFTKRSMIVKHNKPITYVLEEIK
jgi:hypothetical protein